MVNDFLKLKEKSKKVEEISHANPYRTKGNQFAPKDDYDHTIGELPVLDAEVVSETKRTDKKLSEEEIANIGKTGAQVFKGVQGISESAAKGLDKSKKENKFYKKYPDIEDQELAKKLRRLQMEQQYSDLTGDTVVVKTGAEKARDVLQTIGAVAGIGASLFGIGYAIYQMKHGQKPAPAK